MRKSELHRQAVIKHSGDWRKAYFELISDLKAELTAAQQKIQHKDEQIAMLRRVVGTVHSWAVCYSITTAEDMAQNFPHIVDLTYLADAEVESSAWLQKWIDANVVNALESVRDYKGDFLEWHDYIDDLIAKRKGGE